MWPYFLQHISLLFPSFLSSLCIRIWTLLVDGKQMLCAVQKLRTTRKVCLRQCFFFRWLLTNTWLQSSEKRTRTAQAEPTFKSSPGRPVSLQSKHQTHVRIKKFNSVSWLLIFQALSVRATPVTFLTNRDINIPNLESLHI